MSNANRRKLAAPTYFVEMTDDTGAKVFGAGYASPIVAARAVAGVFPEVDAAAFAADWNAFNDSGSTRFAIGMD